ncbi:hypothetical protein PA598K_05262 [Paenibacillus sp. 598K]|nr:hypothetical protein PA598K_05262 [Paenibacillus sp. 598K]
MLSGTAVESELWLLPGCDGSKIDFGLMSGNTPSILHYRYRCTGAGGCHYSNVKQGFGED